jgi:hypothetical protein
MSRRLPVLLVLAALAAGCDDGVTPSLSNFTFHGQAEDSPLVLLLSVDFHDADGDLADGALETFIDDKPTSAGALPLLPLLLAEGLAPGATDGTVDFVLELAFGQDTPEDGATFTLGCRASDGADPPHSSATQEIKLKLSL